MAFLRFNNFSANQDTLKNVSKKHGFLWTFHRSFQRVNAGQSIVEIVIVMGLMAILLPALVVGLIASRSGKAQDKQRLAATGLIRESREAIRSVRERGWANIAANGTYYPVISNGQWTLVSGSETVNGFTRSITIADVQRSTLGAIVTTGGTTDPSSKKITYTVGWTSPNSYSLQVNEYLQRYLDNMEWLTTTQADFNLGTKTGVVTTNTSGGEVQLAAGGSADWCTPALTITAVDLPKSGTANTLSAIEGRVFAGTGENSSGVSFANMSISNTKPPTATNLGTADGYKTNSIFGETNYVYLATDTNSKEIVILDLTTLDPVTLKYSEVGYFDAPGAGNAGAAYVVGNIGYALVDAKMYSFDLSSKSGSRPMLTSVTLSGTGTSLTISGSYAYVTTTSTTQQMQIIQIGTNSTSLSVVGYASLTAQSGRDVEVNSTSTRAYVATSASATQNEFFVVDISSKTGSRSVMGTFDTSGMDPKALTVVTGNKVIIVGSGGVEYQVVNISNEASPVMCGSLNIDTGVNGISSVLEADGDAFSYIITGDSAAELRIIEGGPGGSYAVSGTFESSVLATTSAAAFNGFTASVNQPVSTSILMQVSVAPAIGATCSGVTYTYVGPNGDQSAYYTPNGSSISGVIPLGTYGTNYSNPNKCFRYKTYFSSTDKYQSPELEDVRVNYSP
jgi:type II secretory pathway pseudopilin PulG